MELQDTDETKTSTETPGSCGDFLTGWKDEAALSRVGMKYGTSGVYCVVGLWGEVVLVCFGKHINVWDFQLLATEDLGMCCRENHFTLRLVGVLCACVRFSVILLGVALV